MAQTMQAENRPAPRRKRRGSALKYLAALLAVALLVFVGTRLKGWQEQRLESRTVVLVNPWNYLDDTGYKPHLANVGDGMKLDRSCAAKLKSMLADCRAAGYEPQLLSAYRSREEQEQLFAQQVQRLIEGGTDPEQAEDLAAEAVARPGTSEHELGLAVDIVDGAYPATDNTQERTGTQQWLRENAWRYGFILRYPEGATDLTGAPYEPWHYRYVGEATAWQIYSLGITLEEYSSMFYNEEAEIVFDEAE
ncbi:MAG: M15 family metallopeptidase [Oscillospiraceae bacterium]|nr:M15 family metallopeptidase [Oscillospiraceae bacterium]MBQ9250930.1 M15 family metallopeptidase [Oscillospiraceae bacterium]